MCTLKPVDFPSHAAFSLSRPPLQASLDRSLPLPARLPGLRSMMQQAESFLIPEPEAKSAMLEKLSIAGPMDVRQLNKLKLHTPSSGSSFNGHYPDRTELAMLSLRQTAQPPSQTTQLSSPSGISLNRPCTSPQEEQSHRVSASAHAAGTAFSSAERAHMQSDNTGHSSSNGHIKKQESFLLQPSENQSQATLSNKHGQACLAADPPERQLEGTSLPGRQAETALQPAERDPLSADQQNSLPSHGRSLHSSEASDPGSTGHAYEHQHSHPLQQPQQQHRWHASQQANDHQQHQLPQLKLRPGPWQQQQPSSSEDERSLPYPDTRSQQHGRRSVSGLATACQLMRASIIELEENRRWVPLAKPLTVHARSVCLQKSWKT